MKIARGTLLSGLIILLSIVCLYCAKVEPPPGGPEDRTPPSILTTVPTDKSTKIEKNNTISVYFNEKIDKESVEGSVFISPRFKEDLKFKWKDNTLNIILPESFADSTTYIVNIGTNISDIRRNKLEQSYSFAFSTGEIIDQGKINGLVMQDGKPSSGTTVGLYNFARPDSTIRFDTIYPPYMTQSGKDGEYTFEYIPDGNYFILAFDDKNKNQLFNFPREIFGIPDRRAIIGGIQKEQGINFYLSRLDTASISILSNSMTPDGLLKTRLSKKIENNLISGNLDKIKLVPVRPEAETTPLIPRSVKERGEVESTTFNFFFAGIAKGRYKLQIDADVFSKPDDSSHLIESPEFDIELLPDENPPKIDSISHSAITVYPSQNTIEIGFSEPCLIVESDDTLAFLIMRQDSSLHEISSEWKDEFRLNIQLSELGWDESCTITILERFITDLSGNPLGDSITTYKFRTYNEDSLGSISGEVKTDSSIDGNSTPYIIFTKITGQEILRTAVDGRAFNYSMPPGKYFLKGFLDRNNNGKHDLGSLIPFEYSETTAFYPDTIRVRARFETSGIELIFK